MAESKSQTILIYGPFADEYSLAKVNRSLAIGLAAEIKTSNLPYQVILSASKEAVSRSLEPKDTQRYPELQELYQEYNSEQEYDFLIFNNFPKDPNSEYGFENIQARYKTLYIAWEEDRYPERWVKEINQNIQLVFAASEHTRAVLKRSGIKIPITIVPNALMATFLKAQLPQATNLIATQKKFKFFHNSSGMERKGPAELLAAFYQSFSNQDNVALVIKSFPNINNRFEELLAEYRSKAGAENLPVVELISANDLSDTEILSLYQACDAYLSPSKAEGFNYPVLEAMMLGLPVVTTAWSGQMDFCNDLNAYLLDYKLVPARSHLDNPGAFWAEPNINDLAAKMKQVIAENNSDTQRTKIALAKLTAQQYTWQNSAQAVLSQLEELKKWSTNLKKTNLGVVSTYNTICGIAEYSSYLYPPIQNQLNSITMIANKDAVGRVVVDSDNVIRHWEYGETDFSGFLTELDRIQAETGSAAYDLVHIQYNLGFYTFSALEFLIKGLKQRNFKIVLTPHALRTPGAELGDISTSLQLVDQIIVLNKLDIDYLQGFGLKNISFLPHGNTTFPYQSSKRLRQALNIPDNGQPVIATHGFMVQNKGMLEVLEAIKILKETYPDLTYLAVNSVNPQNMNSQSLAEEFAKKVQEYGLEKNIIHISKFLDKEEIMALLATADLVVFAYPEAKETASGATRLAIAANTPFILTPSSQLADLQSVGKQIPNNKPEITAQAIKELFENKQEQLELKLKMQKYSRSNDWDRIAVSYLAKISELL